VACPWDADFGWTATLWPTPLDDDGDGFADEDPAGSCAGVDNDGDWQVDEDGPNVTDRTIWGVQVWGVQVAVWRKFQLIGGGGTPTGTFSRGSSIVPVAGATAEFWKRVKTGDFVRHRDYGVWCRIAEVDSANSRLILAAPFAYPVAAIGGEIEVASRFHLISTYDATIGPP